MAATSTRPGPGLPWYRYFWPWVIVVLLSTTVVAGLSTVVIAFKYQDSLVRDDWYKDGTAINRRFERERYAASLGLSASLQLDPRAGVVRLELFGPGSEIPESLSLELSHATQSARDLSLVLDRREPGVYQAKAEKLGAGRWYASLEPSPLGAEGRDLARWRLSRSITLPSAAPIAFGEPK